MDHLPLPTDNFARSPIAIPYLCDEKYSYDDQGFLTYPSRCGVDIWGLCEQEQPNLEPWAPFLQAWLWFGLLGETIGVGSRIHIPQQRITSFASFIKTAEDGNRYVVTTNLQESIVMASKKNQAPLFNEFHRIRFDACLSQTNQVVESILATQPCNARIATASRMTDLPILYHVLLSIQVLVQTLHASRTILFPKQPLFMIREPINQRRAPQLVDILLKESGWCPFEITRLPNDVRVRHYLSYIAPFDVRGHHSCTSEKCVWGVFEDTQIHPRHTTEGCSCSSIDIPDAQITKIVDEGDIALVTFSENLGGARLIDVKKFRVEQAESDQSAIFVAISHVRFAGLGNGQAYSLPYCQLSLLQCTANSLLGSKDKCVPFWIDTMCLPRDYVRRKQALRDLHLVYESATKVLVLDPSLARHSIGSTQDAMLRIRYSLWKKRLWTLQEGVQAQELHVLFFNQTIDLEKLTDEYMQLPNPILKPFALSRPLKRETLKQILEKYDGDIKMIASRCGQGDRLRSLRSNLRLGYLASPLYRFLCEDQEMRDSAAVVDTLLEIYATQKCHLDCVKPESIDPSLEFEHVKLAMKRVEEVEKRLPSFF